MSENKELSLEFLEELDEKYNKQFEVTIEIETIDEKKEATLKIDKYFHPQKVKDCVKELIQKMDILKQFESFQNDDSHLIKLWLMLLMVKHFTSLDVPNKFKQQLAVLEMLTETQALYQIFSNFPTEEVQKVIKELDMITHLAMTKIEAYAPLFEKMENERKQK